MNHTPFLTDPAPVETLEQTIGYVFHDRTVLYRALTHSSYTNENRPGGHPVPCNERLEFLGDTVLSLITSDYLFRTYPTKPEGELSKLRAGAVCEVALSGFARQIHLGDYLLLGKGEAAANGRERPSVLADAFEALLAAIYLDGGYPPVQKFLTPFVVEEITSALKTGHIVDPKTRLQQLIQQDPGDLLEYVLTEESGPAHKRNFTVEARLNRNVIGRGSGSTKRAAEQNAAEEALALFGEKEIPASPQ